MSEYYCTQCGTRNQDGALFCASCGAKILPPKGDKQLEGESIPQTKGDFISLSCPNCGGKLEITPDMDRFVCRHCGVEHLVKRQAGTVSLTPVVEGIKRVEGKFDSILTGSEKVAAEQTIQRLKTEISELEKKSKEDEDFIKLNKPYLSRLLFGAIALLIGLASVRFFTMFPNIIKNEDFRIIIFISVPLGFFIGGMESISSHLRSRRIQKQVEQTKKELQDLQLKINQRKQQLDELHRFTVER